MDAEQDLSLDVILHNRWSGSAPLSVEVVEKLGPYLTRYAQTLKVAVYTVGANIAGETVHVLLSLPRNLTIDEVLRHLQPPSARYVATLLNMKAFHWEATQVESVGVGNKEEVAAKIASGQVVDRVSNEPADDNEELPAWLRSALGQP